VEAKGRGGKRTAARFVEVVAASGAGGGEEFEVTLVGGIRVRVPSGFDGEDLRRLLSVLGA
jgi:hypothetical protein